MGILKTLDMCIHKIQEDIIDSRIIFVELDRDRYKEVKEEVESMTTISSKEEKVSDIGACIILGYEGYRFMITENKGIGKSDLFYIAFKTKIL